ncbi:uncharacterized protein LOC142488284 [Ascaphus truei]|uniref:uncharacterized protein LOC142488284 n=1 Tax=Ascaphus truei TaxID=8439 RepID=UPI003F5A8BC9
MSDKFKAKGYPIEVLNGESERIDSLNREELLKPKHSNSQINRIPFVTSVRLSNRQAVYRKIEIGMRLQRPEKKHPQLTRLFLHFLQTGHNVSKLRFQIIEVVLKPRKGGNMVQLLRKSEAFWIRELGTLHPGGLNGEYDLTKLTSLKTFPGLLSIRVGLYGPHALLEALPLEEGESSQHQPSSDPKPARKKRVEKPRNPRFNDQENRALVTGILEHYDSIYGHLVGRTSAASKKEMWDTIVIGVNACGNSVRDKYHCRKRFDDIRSKLKKKIQDQRVHATGTGGGPTPQRLILTPLEELLRPKLLTVVVEGLAGDRDIGIYPSQFPAVAPGGHVSPEMEQVSSPGSASSTLLEEHHGDEDDEYDEDDATEETEIQSCDHEEVPIETVVPPNRPSTSTYDAIVASEGKIVDAENRRHSDMMTVLERMIGLQEETVSQLAHLHRVFIEVPKQLQKINTSFEALVVQQTQANYWRMTNVPQFNTSQPGSVHADSWQQAELQNLAFTAIDKEYSLEAHQECITIMKSVKEPV